MVEVPVDYTHEGKTITLHVGDVLVVTLPVNMLTGLRWGVASYEQQVLVWRGEAVVPPRPSGAMGAGGTVAVFRFQATAVGHGRLVLELRHGNEPDDQVQKYQLQLNVT